MTGRERVQKEKETKGVKREKEEKEAVGGEKVGDGLVREKGEDAGPLKEDAAHRSQSSHLVLNP